METSTIAIIGFGIVGVVFMVWIILQANKDAETGGFKERGKNKKWVREK